MGNVEPIVELSSAQQYKENIFKYLEKNTRLFSKDDYINYIIQQKNIGV